MAINISIVHSKMQSLQRSGEPAPESKGKLIEISQEVPRFASVTEDDIAYLLDMLTRKLGRKQSVLSVKEIMDECSVSDSTVYHWRETGTIPTLAFLQIMREAARRGDMTAFDMVNPQNYTLRPLEHGDLDGSITEEIAEEVEHLGALKREFDHGRYANAEREARKAERDIKTIQAEIRRKRL